MGEAESQQALAQERLASAAAQEAAAEALRQELLQQQREVERQRAAAAAQRAELETARAQVWLGGLGRCGGRGYQPGQKACWCTCRKWLGWAAMPCPVGTACRQWRPLHAFRGSSIPPQHLAPCSQPTGSPELPSPQVERDAAAAAQERAVLADLRIRRLEEQESLIAALAAERAAAVAQQADAERAVDAARCAELSAAKLLGELKAQADGARKQVGWPRALPGAASGWSGRPGCCWRKAMRTAVEANPPLPLPPPLTSTTTNQPRCPPGGAGGSC